MRPMPMSAQHLPPGYGTWAIHAKTDGAATVGEVGLRPSVHDEREIELFFQIEPIGRGRGYALEAAATVIENAARSAGAGEILAYTKPGDLASARVVRRLGFAAAGRTSLATGSAMVRWRRGDTT